MTIELDLGQWYSLNEFMFIAGEDQEAHARLVGLARYLHKNWTDLEDHTILNVNNYLRIFYQVILY